jgi:hypothetical protein
MEEGERENLLRDRPHLPDHIVHKTEKNIDFAVLLTSLSFELAMSLMSLKVLS